MYSHITITKIKIQNICNISPKSLTALQSTLPLPWATTNVFSILIALPFPECHGSGMTQQVALWVWLLPLSIRKRDASVSLHESAVSSLLLLSSIPCRDVLQSIYSPAKRHLSHFQFGAITHKAIWHGTAKSLWRTVSNCFPKWLDHFIFLPAMYESPVAPYSLSALGITSFFLNFKESLSFSRKKMWQETFLSHWAIVESWSNFSSSLPLKIPK